jgi:hypothetical protein
MSMNEVSGVRFQVSGKRNIEPETLVTVIYDLQFLVALQSPLLTYGSPKSICTGPVDLA